MLMEGMCKLAVIVVTGMIEVIEAGRTIEDRAMNQVNDGEQRQVRPTITRLIETRVGTGMWSMAKGCGESQQVG
jgi:acyl-CoA synthetase (NDP forming)